MIHDWDLSETNLRRLSENHYEVAVLGTAAVEPHNFHLPEGQDWRHTTWVMRESCRRAWEMSPKVLCLPVIPFGVDCNLQDFPFAIHVSQPTLDAMVRDILQSLMRYGFKKFVIINGHGGNDFTPLIRQIQCDLDIHVFLCNWWTVGMDRYDAIFDRPEDHAGEMETSVALALYPELVEKEHAKDGKAPDYRFEALKKGWVKTSRNFGRLNDHCSTADPANATAEKGNQYLDLVCERISSFLVELADSPLDEKFPHDC